ncbi:MAG: TetR/AcrR family transcriptional regulator [Sphingosinicella sp.]|nr:TetR/AcrR family transcriptional regulator [Sphingosinicella sp.]
MRERITRSAYDLFQEHGYAGTSMQAIAGAAGVTSGAIHHHFPTKEAIGLAVIEADVSSAFRELWLEPLAAETSALAVTLKVFRKLAKEFDSQGYVRGCPINNLTLELGSMNSIFREPLRMLFDEWRVQLSSALSEERGTLSKNAKNNDATANLVIAAYSGAMSMAKAEQSGGPLRKVADELEKLLAA